jgi:hypothetical protein
MRNRSNVKLTHFGRKTGKSFVICVWFAEIDGFLWVGSQDAARNWVRNVEAVGKAELDFGSGPALYKATRCEGATELERFRKAMLARHPIGSRIIMLLTRGKTLCCFRMEPLADESSDAAKPGE